MILGKERQQIIDYCQKMQERNLSYGTSGNISILVDEDIVISPSGADYDSLLPEEVAVVNLQGEQKAGDLPPSSELFFHLALYTSRPDIGAIVHTHSINATAVACMGMEIPAVHYMVASAGNKVPLAPYATFGTVELARSIQENMADYNAVLVENHGVVTAGKSISEAFACAETVEFVASVYLKCLASGKPNILPEEEMEIVMEKFSSYGKADD